MRSLLNLGLLLLSGSLAAAPLIRNFHPEKVKSHREVHDLASSIREVVIPRLASPSPDSDQGWENAYSCDQFSVLLSKARARARGMQASGDWEKFLAAASKPVNPTRIQLGFDDNYLYLKATCFEKQMARTMSDPKIKRDSRIYSYDNLDLMLSPNRNRLIYYQLSLDMNGNSLDGVCKPDKDKFTSDLSWNPEFKVKTARKSDRWELFLAIPFKEFAPDVREGGFIELNVNRMSLPSKEFTSWNQVERSFHEISRMVRVYLGRKDRADGGVLKKIVHSELKAGTNRFDLTLDPGTADSLVITSRGADRQTRKFKPQPQLKVFWDFADPGKSELEFSLESKGKRLDRTVLGVDIPAPLLVRLQNTEITAGRTLVPGTVYCNFLPVQGTEARFTLGERSQTIPLHSAKNTFELDCAGIAGKVPFKVELLRQGKPVKNASTVIQLTGNEDPFAED